MKPTTHLESFGTMAFYGQLINIVRHNKEWWRKVSRFLNKYRRQMHPWEHIDRNTQREQAYKDIIQSLRDTRLPDDVKDLLKKGLEYEFQFRFPTA
jgi:hypothetical protein